MNFHSSKNSTNKYKLFIFLFVIIITNISQIKAQPLTSICEEYVLEDTSCVSWKAWDTLARWINIPINGCHCLMKVYYYERKCNNNPAIHQIQIVSYVMNLGYKVRVSSEGDWIYPCREALNLFKGSSDIVSLRNNELLDNIFKALVLDIFAEKRSSVPPDIPFMPCYNVSREYFIAKHGACRGFCRVQAPSIFFAYGLDTTSFNLLDTLECFPTRNIITELIDLPAEFPTLNVNIDSVQIALLDSIDLISLAAFLQEINSFIEPEFRLQWNYMVKDAILLMTPVDCTPDYCCIYKIGLCVDNEGNTQVTETRIGDMPIDCIGEPDSTSCPNGENRVTYPCSESCGN